MIKKEHNQKLCKGEGRRPTLTNPATQLVLKRIIRIISLVAGGKLISCLEVGSIPAVRTVALEFVEQSNSDPVKAEAVRGNASIGVSTQQEDERITFPATC